jgi:hypothetical protein
MGERTPTGSGYFPRTPSESAINQDPGKIKPLEKNWERSQSEINLDHRAFMSEISRSSSLEPENNGDVPGGKVSEHSKVYWDLSKATDGEVKPQQSAAPGPGSGECFLMSRINLLLYSQLPKYWDLLLPPS